MSSLISLASSFRKSVLTPMQGAGQQSNEEEIGYKQPEAVDSPEITFLVQGKHRKPKTPSDGSRVARKQQRAKPQKVSIATDARLGSSMVARADGENAEPSDLSEGSGMASEPGSAPSKSEPGVFSPLAARNINSSSKFVAVEAKVQTGLKKHRSSPLRPVHAQPRSPEEHLAMLMKDPVDMEEQDLETFPLKVVAEPPLAEKFERAQVSKRVQISKSPLRSPRGDHSRSGGSSQKKVRVSPTNPTVVSEQRRMGKSPADSDQASIRRSVRFAHAAEMRSPPSSALDTMAQTTPLPASPPDAPSSDKSSEGSNTDSGTKSKPKHKSMAWTPGINRARKAQVGSTPGVDLKQTGKGIVHFRFNAGKAPRSTGASEKSGGSGRPGGKGKAATPYAKGPVPSPVPGLQPSPGSKDAPRPSSSSSSSSNLSRPSGISQLRARQSTPYHPKAANAGNAAEANAPDSESSNSGSVRDAGTKKRAVGDGKGEEKTLQEGSGRQKDQGRGQASSGGGGGGGSSATLPGSRRSLGRKPRNNQQKISKDPVKMQLFHSPVYTGSDAGTAGKSRSKLSRGAPGSGSSSSSSGSGSASLSVRPLTTQTGCQTSPLPANVPAAATATATSPGNTRKSATAASHGSPSSSVVPKGSSNRSRSSRLLSGATVVSRAGQQHLTPKQQQPRQSPRVEVRTVSAGVTEEQAEARAVARAEAARVEAAQLAEAEIGRLQEALAASRKSFGPSMMEKLRREHGEAIATVQRLRSQRDTYATACKQAAARIKTLEENAMKLTRERTKLSGELEAAKATAAEAVSESSSLRSKTVDLISENKEREQEAEASRDAAKASACALVEARAAAEQAENEANEQSARADKSQSDCKRMMAALQKAKAMKEADDAKFKQETESLRSQLEAAQLSATQARAAAEAAQKQSAEAVKGGTASAAEAELSKKHISALKSKCVEIAKALNAARAQAVDAGKRAEAAEASASGAAEGASQQMQEVRAEMDRLKVQLFDAERAKKAAETELVTMTQTNEELMQMLEARAAGEGADEDEGASIEGEPDFV